MQWSEVIEEWGETKTPLCLQTWHKVLH